MRVSSFMSSKVVVARPSDGIRRTFFRMRQHRVRHMPVLNEDGDLVGFISDRDLRRPNWVDETMDVSHAYRLDDNLAIEDLMATDVLVVHTYDTIKKAVGYFLEHRYGALPVLNKDERLVGILSAHDLLRALDQLLDETRKKKSASSRRR